jgi:deoxyribodipyrimidine photo-lyase
MRSIVWFRRDLRTYDNKALFRAAKESDEVIAVYFITRPQWKEHHDSKNKISFWMENLRLLKPELYKLNIPLLILVKESFEEIPAAISELADRHNCCAVYFNSEYEYNEQTRDKNVINALTKINVATKTFHDRILVPPGKVLTGQNRPYSVFTPYRKKWAEKVFSQNVRTLPKPQPLPSRPSVESSDLEILDQYIKVTLKNIWPAGERVDKKRLKDFLAESIHSYHENRDFPAIDGTSSLSPYLAAGIISIRECFAGILKTVNLRDKIPEFNTGAGLWLSELIWREFYTQVLIEFPRVSKSLPFKLITDRIQWEYNPQSLEAWKNGLTGYPIVDAAMRQLNQTGWMHNRLRMIAAMFLSKHLLHDWRQGEKYFMQTLIDGDFAANNGGWQWSASTGTDAVPYFRIFNPFSQSKRYDPEGKFIKRYCPELKPVKASALHDPKKLEAELKKQKIDYPSPIIEYSFARQRAITAFKNLNKI